MHDMSKHSKQAQQAQQAQPAQQASSAASTARTASTASTASTTSTASKPTSKHVIILKMMFLKSNVKYLSGYKQFRNAVCSDYICFLRWPSNKKDSRKDERGMAHGYSAQRSNQLHNSPQLGKGVVYYSQCDSQHYQPWEPTWEHQNHQHRSWVNG